jgi:hypothetical protein
MLPAGVTGSYWIAWRTFKCARSAQIEEGLGGHHMKKRSFLLPLAVSLTALVAGGGIATAKPVTPTKVSAVTEVSVPVTPAPAKPLVLQRIGGTKMAQYHSSHASHASHASHYSSR